MAKIYYKVVNNELKSAVISKNQDRINMYCSVGSLDFCVQYKINEWVKPVVYGTKLMVFNDLFLAEDFANTLNDSNIYKCHVKNPSRFGFIAYLDDINRLYPKFLRLIKNKKKRTNFRTGVSALQGTVFCSAVKLIEKIST